MPMRRSWVEVSQRALKANLRALRHSANADPAPGTVPSGASAALLAVIKANAYGHGAAVCAPVLARAGAEWLGVTDAAEGALVRNALAEAGLRVSEQPAILVMCGLEREDAELIWAHRLTPVVWFPEQLRWLADAVAATEDRIAVHVEVDTGMARQGVRAGEELAGLLSQLRGCSPIRLNGLFTHFASAEIVGAPLTQLQAERFQAAVEQVRAAGQPPPWLHAGNTSSLDQGHLPAWLRTQAAALGARPLARSGLALYGYALPLEGVAPAREGDGQTRQRPAAQLAPVLQPVGTWKTRVIAIKDLRAGESVGYNATFTARRPMRLALLPVGYADGLRRELSSANTRPGGWVMLGGHRAPIVGRVSMNLTSVDVTAIPHAAIGDEVILLGDGISAEDHAGLAGTIAYEILCGMRGQPVLVS